MRPRVPGCALALLIFSGVVADAQIRWDATRASPVFANGRDQATIVFAGRNTGSDTKTIESISSSCDCTTAKATRTTIAPGEICEIQVVVSRSPKNPNPGSTIYVVMGKGEIHTLTVDHVSVDEVQPTPVFVWWKKGEPAIATEVVFDAGEDTLPITTVKLLNQDGKFECVPEQRNAHRWTARIAPRKTDVAGVTQIHFAIRRGGEAGGAAESRATVYAKIVDFR